jgi:hypothetical protein
VPTCRWTVENHAAPDRDNPGFVKKPKPVTFGHLWSRTVIFAHLREHLVPRGAIQCRDAITHATFIEKLKSVAKSTKK